MTAPQTAAGRLRDTLAEDGWPPGSLAMNQLDEALREAAAAERKRIRAAIKKAGHRSVIPDEVIINGSDLDTILAEPSE